MKVEELRRGKVIEAIAEKLAGCPLSLVAGSADWHLEQATDTLEAIEDMGLVPMPREATEEMINSAWAYTPEMHRVVTSVFQSQFNKGQSDD